MQNCNQTKCDLTEW